MSKKSPKDNGRDKLGKFVAGQSTTNYRIYLDSLTPEEHLAHMADRKQRKSMRDDLAAIIEANRDLWLADIHNALRVQVAKAKEGDTRALDSLYEKVIGKVQSKVEVSGDAANPLLPAITVNFTDKKDGDKDD